HGPPHRRESAEPALRLACAGRPQALSPTPNDRQLATESASQFWLHKRRPGAAQKKNGPVSVTGRPGPREEVDALSKTFALPFRRAASAARMNGAAAAARTTRAAGAAGRTRRAVARRGVMRPAARVRVAMVPRIRSAQPLPTARWRGRPRVQHAWPLTAPRRAEVAPARGTGSATHPRRAEASARTSGRLRSMIERCAASASRCVRRRPAGESCGTAARRQWNRATDHSRRGELRRGRPHDVGTAPVLEVMYGKAGGAICHTCIAIGVSNIYASNIHGTADVSGGAVVAPSPPWVEDFIRRQRHPTDVAEAKADPEANSTAEAEESDQRRRPIMRHAENARI